jgi:hypothetical protein
MPIKRRDLEEKERKEKTALDELRREIKSFLQNNSEEMFTSEEILKAVKYPELFQGYDKHRKTGVVADVLLYLDLHRKIVKMENESVFYYGIEK